MKVKKNSVVTVKLPDDLFSDIKKMADEKDWTVSHAVSRLIQLGLLGSLAGYSDQEEELENEYYCVDCIHFQKCLEKYQLEYEELHENSICGNFEKYFISNEK